MGNPSPHSPDTSADVTAADVLAELDETLHEVGIELCFAEMKGPVKDKQKRFGLFARLGEQAFFPTVGSAVGSYLATHAVDWQDWEDRKARFRVLQAPRQPACKTAEGSCSVRH